MDLFSSYGLTQKAIDLLETVLERAPRYTPALEKLLDLSLGAGQSKRTAELAEKLSRIYTERDDTASAERFAELHRRFQRAAALEPEPPPAPAPSAAPAPPAEFQIPSSDAEFSIAAPGENELVEEVGAASGAPEASTRKTAESTVQEVDLSEEWAAISGAPEAAAARPAESTGQEAGTSDEWAAISNQVVKQGEAPEAPAHAARAEDTQAPELRASPPQPLRPPKQAEPEPVEYELELVEEALSPSGLARVSPIRPPAHQTTESKSPLGDLTAELNAAFDGGSVTELPAPSNGSAQPPGAPGERAALPSDTGGPLGEIFDEFRKELDELQMDEDPETHYNLGVAYREMGLLEEAISEFQKVMQAHDRGRDFRYAMQCCTLLALAFIDKGQPEIASFWYERALKTPGLDQDAVLALVYDLGVAQELAGQSDAALKSYQQVYAMNIDYRDISERIGSLRHR